MDKINTVDHLKTQTENLKEASVYVRKEIRELWSKILLLSSAILGFSITISTNNHLSVTSFWFLKVGWILLLINIVLGLILLKKESEFQKAQGLANLAKAWDEIDITLPAVTQKDKNKFLALIYLHDLRVVPTKELPFSQLANDIFEENKRSLESRKMIKHPERFYSYSHMNIINWVTYVFEGSFIMAIIFMTASVIFL